MPAGQSCAASSHEQDGCSTERDALHDECSKTGVHAHQSTARNVRRVGSSVRVRSRSHVLG